MPIIHVVNLVPDFRVIERNLELLCVEQTRAVVRTKGKGKADRTGIYLQSTYEYHHGAAPVRI